MMTMDKKSWELGYEDGQNGTDDQRSAATDQLAYSSGKIEGEGEAEAEKPAPAGMKM